MQLCEEEAVDTDIFVKSRNHVIYHKNEQTFNKNNEVEPVQLLQMNILTTYRKDLSWINFYVDSRVQKGQQVLNQQSYMLVSVAYLAYPSGSQNIVTRNNIV